MNPIEKVDQAFIYIMGTSFVLLFLITAVMIYFVVKYRRSKHPVSADIRGNWKLELVWITIPTLMALSMFYVGWVAYTGLRNVPAGAIEIDVLGQKYSWILMYDNDKETENELVVPVGKPIKLNITSNDVVHSFFLPAFRIKVDAVKGITTYAWFLPDKLGEYIFHCTEYCGTGHAVMNGLVKVVPVDEYEKWLEMDEDDEDE